MAGSNTETTAGGATGGWRSLLGNRLLLALLGVSLIPLALMGIATYQAASTALVAEAFAKLETVRTITAKSVERYFQTLHNEIRVFSEDRMAVDACEQFCAAAATVVADNQADDKANHQDNQSHMHMILDKLVRSSQLQLFSKKAAPYIARISR